MNISNPADAIAETLLTARGDMIRRSATAAERFAKGSLNQILTMGSDDPGWADTPGLTSATTGSYAGDDTDNRAIPHGMGVIPDLVIIIGNNNSAGGYIAVRTHAGVYLTCISTRARYTTTISDATNFHVGLSSDYYASVNEDGSGYRWYAFEF